MDVLMCGPSVSNWRQPFLRAIQREDVDNTVDSPKVEMEID